MYLETPESQEALDKILEDYKKDESMTLEVRTVSKKLVPYDIVISIVVQVATRIIYDAIQRLAKDFSARKIKYRLGPEARETVAQSLLVKNGVEDYHLKERVDMQDSSEYVFSDKKGKKHHITVSSDGMCRYRVA